MEGSRASPGSISQMYIGEGRNGCCLVEPDSEEGRWIVSFTEFVGLVSVDDHLHPVVLVTKSCWSEIPSSKGGLAREPWG